MIDISDIFLEKWPHVSLGLLSCSVTVEQSSRELQLEIENESARCRQSIKSEEISQNEIINAARKVYRTFGKDPARYRLSAEALLRRIVKGESLYLINNVVDCVNLLSFTSGYSIGGYDQNKISGKILLDIGRADDVYTGLGRGILNIDGLPVLRDSEGAFGSPTSDSVRTCVAPQTSRFLMVVFDFGKSSSLAEFLDHSESILNQYTGFELINRQIIER